MPMNHKLLLRCVAVVVLKHLSRRYLTERFILERSLASNQSCMCGTVDFAIICMSMLYGIKYKKVSKNKQFISFNR